MKTKKSLGLLLGVLFLLTINAEAQKLLIDDFSTGHLVNTVFGGSESDFYHQSSSNSIGGQRLIKIKSGTGKRDQSVQFAVKNELLMTSFGYNTTGTMYVIYGKTLTGKDPLNLDLTTYTNLKIEFEAKSSTSGIYVLLNTNAANRAFYSSHVQEREGKLTITIPLSDFETVGDSFNWEEVNQIKFQFDSRSIVGHNFAINKIWFE